MQVSLSRRDEASRRQAGGKHYIELKVSRGRSDTNVKGSARALQGATCTVRKAGEFVRMLCNLAAAPVY